MPIFSYTKILIAKAIKRLTLYCANAKDLPSKCQPVIVILFKLNLRLNSANPDMLMWFHCNVLCSALFQYGEFAAFNSQSEKNSFN